MLRQDKKPGEPRKRFSLVTGMMDGSDELSFLLYGKEEANGDQGKKTEADSNQGTGRKSWRN
jgi:hypothetical protein